VVKSFGILSLYLGILIRVFFKRTQIVTNERDGIVFYRITQITIRTYISPFIPIVPLYLSYRFFGEENNIGTNVTIVHRLLIYKGFYLKWTISSSPALPGKTPIGGSIEVFRPLLLPPVS
jgi:hypothetical protein